MTPERYARLKDIFQHAVELPAAQRAAALDRLCPDDPELRREVEDLLRTQEQLPLHSGLGVVLDPDDLPAELEIDGKYRIVRRIGDGGMGTVYEAEQLSMRRCVALKILAARPCRDQQARQRFLEEQRAFSRLPSHPNVVFGLDVGEWNKFPYLVMELLTGCDLEQWLKEQAQQPVAVSDACDMICQAAEGLQFLHIHNMVHRDIKLANLWRMPEGTIKILDLGLTRFLLADPDRTALTVGIAGTPDYMAPEQGADTHAADIRADIYGLGASLYTLLTGAPPFAESTANQGHILGKLEVIQNNPVPSLRQRRPDVPAELAQLAERMLAKDPSERPQEPLEVICDLNRWISTEPVKADPGRLSSAPAEQSLLCASVKIHEQPLTEGPAPQPLNPQPRQPRIRRLATAPILGLLILSAALAAAWYYRPVPVGSEDKAASPLAALHGVLDVYVRRPADGKGEPLHLADPGALPLRTGDAVWLTVTLNRPAHCYLLWIDPDGQVYPGYPWNEGDWDDRPWPDTKVLRFPLRLPNELDEAFELPEGQSGMATLVLLAREQTPLPARTPLAAQLSGLPRQTAQDMRATVWFENGVALDQPPGERRQLRFFNTKKLHDPVIATQQRLWQELRGEFDYMLAVSFARQGSGVED